MITKIIPHMKEESLINYEGMEDQLRMKTYNADRIAYLHISISYTYSLFQDLLKDAMEMKI